MIILCSSNALPLTPHFSNHMTAHVIPHSPLPLISRIRNPYVFRHKHNTCQYQWRLLLLLASALLRSSANQQLNKCNPTPSHLWNHKTGSAHSAQPSALNVADWFFPSSNKNEASNPNKCTYNDADPCAGCFMIPNKQNTAANSSEPLAEWSVRINWLI